jgi:hypothetical protein
MNPQLGKDYRSRDAPAWAPKARDRTVATLADIANPSKSGSFAINFRPGRGRRVLYRPPVPDAVIRASRMSSRPKQISHNWIRDGKRSTEPSRAEVVIPPFRIVATQTLPDASSARLCRYCCRGSVATARPGIIREIWAVSSQEPSHRTPRGGRHSCGLRRPFSRRTRRSRRTVGERAGDIEPK